MPASAIGGSSFQQIQLVFLLLLIFLVGFGSLAERIKVPYPIVLVIGGLLLSFVPLLPKFRLDPDVIFFVVLPPILFSAGVNTSWRDFRENLVSIVSLAFGLVAFTVAGVSYAANMLLPDFDWRLGLVLGAVVSAPDAIAAIAIAKKVHLPQRISEILEGESLVNDAACLLALEFSTRLVVSGETPSFAGGAGQLIFQIGAGIAAGLLVGKVITLLKNRTGSAPIEVTASFLTPYLAYLGAEELHASGVLAAVACGIYLGRRSSTFFSSEVRLQSRATWSTVTFILNGIVFLLVGLQLRGILGSIRGVSRGQLFEDAAQTAAIVIVLRLLWVYPAAYISNLVHRRRTKQIEPALSNKATFIVGWTGMRGVVALATAISLPQTLANGTPFPQRNIIIFLTFCVIFVTLVGQGLTLPPIIRWLGMAGAEQEDPEEQPARQAILAAALARLEELRQGDDPAFEPVYSEVAQQYRRRLAMLTSDEKQDGSVTPEQVNKYRYVSGNLRQRERSTALELRDRNRISDHLLRKFEQELDLLDARY